MDNPSAMLQKTAVHFAKTGPAVYHSHHDMIRFWERAVKRADLPVRLTQGFNPRPRIIFPHALGLGIASRHEEVELELHTCMASDELLERLRRAAGDTLDITGSEDLPPVKKSRQLTASSYRIRGWDGISAAAMDAAITELLARTEIIVERGAPGNRRKADIRPYVSRLAYDASAGTLELELKHTTAGSGRPDEVARLIAAATGADPFAVTIEKTAMTLE